MQCNMLKYMSVKSPDGNHGILYVQLIVMVTIQCMCFKICHIECWKINMYMQNKTEHSKTILLTANHHHGYWKNLLSISGRSNVSKSYCCKACHGKVERGYVQWVFTGSSFPLPWAGSVVPIWGPDTQCQLVEPAICFDCISDFIDHLIIPNAVPYTG